MNQEKKNFFTAKNVATLGILLALVIVLQWFGGSLSFGLVTLNFSLIPIVVGALVLGPVAGALLGLANGIVVLIQVIITPAGFSFYYIIWTNSPLITSLICLLKTTIAGLVCGFVFRAIQKKNAYVGVFVASGLVPIINTGLFILGCLCMSGTIGIFQTEYVKLLTESGAVEQAANIASMNIMAVIVIVLVTINFIGEFVVNLLVAPALHTVYRVVEKRFSK